ncbi:fumarylacetoacetate hydrolase family protein [Pseudonocardia sp. KRD-184]|uniref:Fumarylacetoacetate hydrolase family protein n=1 Tax=Pseudonocardia oceani TaxID=2792013 RepID=A0ABS6U454_9PSEU|nr:fumarylacetoacetate hydrolase family protein [Pseudonocardia oceani]MBW0091207.1 fumarylacetoacetate hydrolase family protein [Pseudonocardia oceani]MBW0098309.1 fumarylacetoacetate hydrolase family protein [Pseudonocardia oceani]MBW0108988.1 fumarylacetoacetate hydrolase family protein [Pseudonocardia oceani]MBW0124865.1 fumarylacetoacetate hydrolase family protein [Pseudonocardia oceani]MBW0126993.1 fumarylacetoacetate hydrolase family protein [Pseudonocardia oceani]
MRLARFTRPDGREGFGVVDGEQVVDLAARVPSLLTLLADPAAAATADGDPRFAVADVRWLPPVTDAAKIVCAGLNFSTHAAETAHGAPTTRTATDHPTLFTRFPDSFVGAGEAVVRGPEGGQLDWEGEAALVIGTPGRRIPEASALEHVAGWTCMAENSVRDWQLHSGQAVAGKNWEASGALGPWVVTADEIGDKALTVTTRLNGDVVQHDTTDHLTFPAAALIAYVSTFTSLRTGDVIALGTPQGVGFRQDPPRFLRPGDEVEVEVDLVGVLRHAVVDAPATDGS